MADCRNYQATKKQIAVSAYLKETAMNVPQTLDVTFIMLMTSIINLTQRSEDNSDHSTGEEEATNLYLLGFRAEYTMEHTRAMAQHFAFLLSYAMGNTVSSVVTDTNNEVYDHVITLMTGFESCAKSNPSFTAGQVLSEIRSERIYSNFVKKVTETYNMDDFVQISADISATGAHDTNVDKETITALDDVAQLTLSSGNTVSGATEEERIGNIDYIRVIDTVNGQYVYVDNTTITGCTGADPSVIDFTNPLSAPATASTTWEVLFLEDNAALDSLPAINDEYPLRTTNLSMIHGGKYVSGDVEGGHTVDGEIKNMTVTYENENLDVQSAPGGTSDAANRAVRHGRIHEITFNQDFINNLIQQGYTDGDIFAVKLVAQGTTPLEHGGSATVYPTITTIFPQVKISIADKAVDGKLLAENVTFKPLGDATNGARTTTVRNKIAAYAA